MKLIADSGSTQCDWVLSNNGEIIYRKATKGINPFFQAKEDISMIVSELSEINFQNIEYVYFYGAGCAFPDKKEIIKNVLSEYFPDSNIEIESDLLAAARSLCGKEPGIACILGTGSNSCFYNGKEIEKNVSPLGYILGDEGSGAVIGKIFIGNLLKNQYPEYLSDAFFTYYKTTNKEIMDAVYRKPFPNRYLAQFTRFLALHVSKPVVYDLIFNAFVGFINKNVIQYDYKTYPVYFTGSIAFHFEDILRNTCMASGILPAEITKSPMNGLIEFHQ